ncbi:MAG: WYL domain-containing protein, partial [Prevotella sp.]|nr:WYL domain-containing protein [Prevotella sp.]
MADGRLSCQGWKALVFTIGDFSDGKRLDTHENKIHRTHVKIDSIYYNKYFYKKQEKYRHINKLLYLCRNLNSIDMPNKNIFGGYGEVTLVIEPNRELRGKIMLYGENLEVMQPLSLREQIKDILMKQLE